MPRHPASIALCALLTVTACASGGGRLGLTTVRSETGIASFYSHAHHGHSTASGECYDENALTAAHRELPFGTRVRVTNLENDRSVVVRVNDRGPFTRGRVVDVSRRAARELGFLRAGTARVRVDIVGR